MNGRIAAVMLAGLLAACSSSGTTDGTEPAAAPSGTERAADATGTTPARRHPDIVEVEVSHEGGDRYRFAVTVSSPYDSPERYADAWRVLSPDGAELGVRELAHPHAGEQPFTRSATFSVPAGIGEVTVQGRDLANGYGGVTRTVSLPGR